MLKLWIFGLIVFAGVWPHDSAAQGQSSIPFNDPAHAAFFKYQSYLAGSKPYGGRLFPYFRIYLGGDGVWVNDDRDYPPEHWFSPNHAEDWKGLTPDQQSAKIHWTEDALTHLLQRIVDDPSILAQSQPNARELSELLRSVWGKDFRKKFKDLATTYEERDNPKKKSNYDKALAAARDALKQIAPTLPPLAESLNKPETPASISQPPPVSTTTVTTISSTTTTTPPVSAVTSSGAAPVSTVPYVSPSISSPTIFPSTTSSSSQIKSRP